MSLFRKAGGFLNNVDGVITDYQFTDAFPGAGTPKKGQKKSDFHSLYVLLSVTPDGAEEALETTLFAGDADAFTVSDDGHTIEPNEEGWQLGENTPWARLINSLVETGFPIAKLEEGQGYNYEVILGSRVRFVQEKDAAGTDKFGKRKDKKTGKEYDRTETRVAEVYELPGAGKSTKSSNKQAAAGKTTVKGGTKPAGGKANGKVEEDVTELATETLMAVLMDNDGSIVRTKLPVKVAQKLGMKHPQREAVSSLIQSKEFLETQDGWTYDAADKTQTISMK